MDPKRAKKLLAKERLRIEKELSRFADSGEGEASAGSSQSRVDVESELFEQERDQSLVEALHAELAAIERAEQRLEAGTFGVSVESGDPIPDERLEVQPWAERTVKEQAVYEAARRYAGSG